MLAPALSIIPAEAGIQRMVGLDSRLRGNDMDEGFVKRFKGFIFIEMMWVNCGSPFGIMGTLYGKKVRGYRPYG